MKKINITLNLLMILSLSACGAIRSFFPDKAKEYQLTSEIPELRVPADLNYAGGQAAQQINTIPSIPDSKIPVPEKDVPANSEKKPAVHVELVEYSGGAPRIRIEETIQRTWRIVGKALSRNAIEIINRNEYENLYAVQYDPNFKNVEDGTLWDEVLFIFGKDPANEQEYKIRLAENGRLTEILVLDKNDTPLYKGNGFKLLNLLYKTIKDDLNTTK